MSSRLLLLTSLLLCDLTVSTSDRHMQGSLSRRSSISLPIGSHEQDSLILPRFPRQTYNITGNVVLTVPVTGQTDMAAVLLLLKQTQRRQLVKPWLTLEAMTTSGHILNLHLNYWSRNNSLLREPTITIQLDETGLEQEVTVYFQPSRHVVTVFLDCKELINRELYLSRPSMSIYSAMQLLEISEYVVDRAAPTARICPELRVVCSSLWTRQKHEIFTRQPSRLPSRDSHQRSSHNFYQWGPWEEWSTCSKSCGRGKQTRERLCRASSHTLSHDSSVHDCHGDRIEMKSCRHKWKCSELHMLLPEVVLLDLPTFLKTLKLKSDRFVTCNVSGNGFVSTFKSGFISFQPDCAHVLAEDCVSQSFKIFAVWEACQQLRLAQCITNVVIRDADVGEVIITNEDRVYVNGEPKDSNWKVFNKTLYWVGNTTCAVRFVGLKGYVVCYNGSTGDVSVTMDKSLNLSRGLCGRNRHVDADTVFPNTRRTPSDSDNIWTEQTQATYFQHNNYFKTSWQCKGCSSRVVSKAILDAQLECNRGLHSFEACRENMSAVDFHRLKNRCQNRVCRCPDSHKAECLCNALSEIAIICEQRGVPIKWRTPNFCYKPCDSPVKEYHDWRCAITCKDSVVMSKEKPFRCPLQKYASGCHCKYPGWVLMTGDLNKSRCIPSMYCPCQERDRLIAHRVVVERDGRNCTCLSGLLKCGPAKPVIITNGDQVLYGRRFSPLTVICTCGTTNGTQGPNVTIVRQGNAVATGSGMASLQISSLNVSTVGMYACVAKNAMGSSSAQIEVKVAVPPKLKSISDSLTIPEGSRNVTISCGLDPDGEPHPQPNVTWTLNGRPLLVDGKRLSVQKISRKSIWRLIIDTLLRNDSGLYSCNASNLDGWSAKSTNVTVVVSDSGILTFLLEPRDTSVRIGGTARLSCSAIGDSSHSLEIKWLKDGRPLNMTSPRIVKRSFKLTIIKNVRENDAGMYECRAVSGNRTIRTTAFLAVNDGDTWSHWSEWSQCGATCGNEAIATRHRFCNNPPCKGKKTESRACSSRPCPGECYSWGNVHGVTFDGQSYSFRGDCDYYLAEECERKPAFSVRHSMKRCQASDIDTCSKEIGIFVRDLKSDYVLDGNTVTIPRRHKKINLPYRNRDVSITDDGLFITFRTDGLTVRYDGQNRVYVKVGQKYRNKTCGLCGRFDDERYNRAKETGLNGIYIEHGKQWTVVTDRKSASRCSTLPSPTTTCNPQIKKKADEYCSALLHDYRFVLCHGTLHPQEFYERCRRLVCECPSEMTTFSCSCDAYASYVAMCSQLGIQIQWNNRDACYGRCGSSSKVFTHCRPPEQFTCSSSKNRRRNTRVSQCDQAPELGCNCPEGTVSHKDRCIYKTDCPCSTHISKRVSEDPLLVWTDDCSIRNCTGGSALPPNSCTEDHAVVATKPHSLSVIEGKSFQLICDALSRLTTPPRYQWFRNAARIEGESGSFTRQTKAGRYSCRAEGGGPMSNEAIVTVVSDPVSTCVETPLDKWVLLPRNCQHADSGARRVNVRRCSGLPCINVDDNTRPRRCRNADFYCRASSWTSVTISCSRSSVASFTMATISQCGCTCSDCPQRNATLYGKVTWAQTGAPVRHSTIQGLDGRVASVVVNGRYQLDVSLNLYYLALTYVYQRQGPSDQLYSLPLLKVLPFLSGHSLVHHVHLLLPTDTLRVDCRSSTMLTLSSFNNSGGTGFFPLQTSLLIGRNSFRYKNGSICLDSVTFVAIYTSRQTPSLSAESPGVFEYANHDGSSSLIKPLFAITFAAFHNADTPVDVIRPVRFHIHSLTDVLTSTTRATVQDDAISRLQLFLLSESSGIWRSHADGKTINSSDTGLVNNGNYSSTGVFTKANQSYTVGRKVNACYAHVGTVDAAGNRLGGIIVAVEIVYKTPYMPTTSRLVTDHNGEKCVPIACHYEAIITAAQRWSMEPVALFPSGRSDDQTNIAYHKNGAIHILSSAPTDPPIYASLQNCQDSPLSDPRFVFVTPELMSTFTAVEQEGLKAPLAWRPVLSEPFYFVKVKVIGTRGRQYGVRASSYSVGTDGYKLYGWRQERAELNQSDEHYVCLEFTFPRKSGATRNNTVVVIDINSNLETGEGSDLCHHQWFSSILLPSGPPSDAKKHEFTFVPPVNEFGSFVGVFTDSSRRQAESDCLSTSSEPASQPGNGAAVVFQCG